MLRSYLAGPDSDGQLVYNCCCCCWAPSFIIIILIRASLRRLHMHTYSLHGARHVWLTHCYRPIQLPQHRIANPIIDRETLISCCRYCIQYYSGFAVKETVTNQVTKCPAQVQCCELLLMSNNCLASSSVNAKIPRNGAGSLWITTNQNFRL